MGYLRCDRHSEVTMTPSSHSSCAHSTLAQSTAAAGRHHCRSLRGLRRAGLGRGEVGAERSRVSVGRPVRQLLTQSRSAEAVLHSRLHLRGCLLSCTLRSTLDIMPLTPGAERDHATGRRNAFTTTSSLAPIRHRKRALSSSSSLLSDKPSMRSASDMLDSPCKPPSPQAHSCTQSYRPASKCPPA